ncbi:MAG: FliH/SctL family protein [Alkaliphilus sp.]
MSDFSVLKATNVILKGKKEIEYKLVNIVELFEEKTIIDGDNLENREESNETKAEDVIVSANIQYEEIIRKAKTEAEVIMKEAYGESTLLFEKTKKEAYDIGFKEGEVRGFENVETHINEAVAIKKKMHDEKKKMAGNLKTELIQLVLDTVEKVLLHVLSEDNEMILKLIETGIHHCTFTEILTIRVSEEDLDYVNESKNKIFLMTEGVEKLDIKVDKSLARGSVVIETPAGTVDSSMTTQMEIVKKTFNELLRGE